MNMPHPSNTSEPGQALRWLIANRRPDVSIEQAVRLICTVMPCDHRTMQTLRRIAEEEEAKVPSHLANRQSLLGLPPRRYVCHQNPSCVFSR